jgi:hypothetical protein
MVQARLRLHLVVGTLYQGLRPIKWRANLSVFLSGCTSSSSAACEVDSTGNEVTNSTTFSSLCESGGSTSIGGSPTDGALDTVDSTMSTVGSTVDGSVGSVTGTVDAFSEVTGLLGTAVSRAIASGK